MNKISKFATLIIFFGLLIAFPIITVFSDKEKFSEIENKTLSTFPEFNIDNVMERDYMNGIETFLADHFVGRTDWISAKANFELATGKKEINGVYILKDRLVEKLEEPNYDAVNKNLSAINNFSSVFKMPVFMMIVPTSSGIYIEDLPNNAPIFDQKAFIDYCYESLNSNIIKLDAYNALYPTRDEYIYYRNDHHWTSLGAYYVYASTIKKMGFTPILSDKYDIEHANNSFKGTLFSKVLYNGFKADTIDYYLFRNGAKVTSVEISNGIENKTYDSIYFRDYLKMKDKYSSFLGSNEPLVTIKTDVDKDNKLLVIKDSYAHCYVPFLTQNYSQITMVDLRYINISLDEFMEQNGMNINDFNQTLFLYNGSTLATDVNIKKLSIIK